MFDVGKGRPNSGYLQPARNGDPARLRNDRNLRVLVSVCCIEQRNCRRTLYLNANSTENFVPQVPPRDSPTDRIKASSSRKRAKQGLDHDPHSSDRRRFVRGSRDPNPAASSWIRRGAGAERARRHRSFPGLGFRRSHGRSLHARNGWPGDRHQYPADGCFGADRRNVGISDFAIPRPASPDFLDMATKLGATACLRKPFGPEPVVGSSRVLSWQRPIHAIVQWAPEEQQMTLNEPQLEILQHRNADDHGEQQAQSDASRSRQRGPHLGA